MKVHGNVEATEVNINYVVEWVICYQSYRIQKCERSVD